MPRVPNASCANATFVQTKDYFNALIFAIKNSTASNVDVNIDNQSVVVQEDLTQQDQELKKFYWNTVQGSVYQKDLEEAYEQIIYWR